MSRRDEYLADLSRRFADGLVSKPMAEAYDAGHEHGRDEVARMGEAWSLLGIVERLCEAAEHLLDGHSCDSHGHEGVRCAAVAGREWLSTVQAHGWTEPPLLTERATQAAWGRMAPGSYRRHGSHWARIERTSDGWWLWCTSNDKGGLEWKLDKAKRKAEQAMGVPSEVRRG